MNDPSHVSGYRLGEFVVDLDERSLTRGADPVEIQDKPFELLLVLLESEGRVVTREQIIRRLWPEGTFVDFERGLNTAVRKVRRALGEHARTPRFIATVPRRGYRLLETPERITRSIQASMPAATLERPSAALRGGAWRVARVVAVSAAAVVLVGLGMVLPRPHVGDADRPCPEVSTGGEPVLRGASESSTCGRPAYSGTPHRLTRTMSSWLACDGSYSASSRPPALLP